MSGTGGQGTGLADVARDASTHLRAALDSIAPPAD
jgi:hypothetical protein